MRFWHWVFFIGVIFCIAACQDNPTSDSETVDTVRLPSPTPYGNLTILMNEFSRVDFLTSEGFTPPVPLTDSASATNTLTLRVNGEDFHYDLGEQSFEISFESEFFMAVNGRKIDGDYFLEALPIQRTPSPTPDVSCPDAPPTQFKVGDTVQVDFNGVGALRLRYDPYDDRSMMLVYDNALLNLVGGPVCGFDRWVWKVYYAPKDATGWASEGILSDPWMCPLDNPECGN